MGAMWHCIRCIHRSKGETLTQKLGVAECLDKDDMAYYDKDFVEYLDEGW